MLAAWKPGFIHSDISKKLGCEIIRDFHNVADESSFDEKTVTRLFGAPPPDAMLVFGRAEAVRSAQSV